MSMKKIRDGATRRQPTLVMMALVMLPGCSKIIPAAEAAVSASAATSAALTYLSPAATGIATRYWDCCKASYAWTGKAPVSHPVNTCTKDGKTVFSNYDTKSGCDGGPAFMCANQQPWSVSSAVSYGFAAASLVGKSESDIGCACYELQFTSGPVTGKKFVVQVINGTGGLGKNHFQLLIPGGGVGIFNGCTAQYNAPTEGWGARYGGVSSRVDCDKLPADLKPGCQWRFDWFQNADNPNVTFREVICPKAITDRTGCIRK